MCACHGRQADQKTAAGMFRELSLILLSALVLGSVAPSSFADSKQLDDRDRAVDLALGGLEQGSRLSRSTAASPPAGASRKAPGAAVSPADAGAARAVRGATGTGLVVGGITPRGGQGGPETSRSPSSGERAGETKGTGPAETTSRVSAGVEAGGETNAGGGETTGGIHVEAGTEGGELNAGTQVETGETSLNAGTGVETGIETGGTDLGGQIDVTGTTDTSSTELVGSAELTSPAPIDTTTATELDSTLTGGADDASVESDVTEEAVGDNADDCTVAGLISCPSFP